MIVVADTTPLRYLIAIEHEDILPALYGSVLIPPAVAAELNHASTPEAVRLWMSGPPDWLEVRQPLREITGCELDRGESEAIALAMEVTADLLLVDEWDARREAARRHLRVAGTLRVLADAARLGLIDLKNAFERLRETNFRVSPELLQSLLDEVRDQKVESSG